VTYVTPPAHKNALERRLLNLAGNDALATRRRTTMALVVVGQMMPEGAIKGGSAMALRFGGHTRFTRDLDAAQSRPLNEFLAAFEESLRDGWSGFTGSLVEKAPPSPVGVPTAYIMQPFEVKLDYRGRPWCTVKFELGHNEIGDVDQPELRLADDLADLFTQVGLERPQPVPVMSSDHQIAQKLHAVSAERSDRARDLVDLQLLAAGEILDLTKVASTCRRLFDYRRAQPWPPTVVERASWAALYREAAEDLNGVLPDVASAVAWVNALIGRVDEA